MSYNVQLIINSAMKKMGILARSESPNADESTDAMQSLNWMLDSWSIRGIVARARLNATYTLTGGTRSYQIGPTATNFVQIRPIQIATASVIYPGGSQLEIPLDVETSLEQYQAFGDRLYLQGLPSHLFYDPQFPNGLMYIYPIPDQAYSIEIDSYVALQEVTTLSSVFNLEPAYFEAIVYNLAARMAPDYGIVLPPIHTPRDQCISCQADELFRLLLANFSTDLWITSDYQTKAPPSANIFTID